MNNVIPTVIIIFSVLAGVIACVTFYLLTRLKKHKAFSLPPTQLNIHITKLGIAFYFLLTAVFVVGFAQQHIAPETVFGQFIATHKGMIIFVAIIIVIGRSVEILALNYGYPFYLSEQNDPSSLVSETLIHSNEPETDKNQSDNPNAPENMGHELTINEYAELFKNLSLPSEEQMRDFADYVSSAHSWYKHLPGIPPGAPFYFYLDPNAGYSQILMSNGQVGLYELQGRGFHYSELPTKEYQNRFGALAYTCLRGTSVSLISANGEATLQADKSLTIRNQDGQAYRLPNEVIQAGVSKHTGSIFTDCRDNNIRMVVGLMRYHWEEHQSQDNWSADPIGMQAVEKIIKRADEAFKQIKTEEHKDRPNIWSDETLTTLLREERNRQLEHMITAMKNVIQLVDEHRQS